MSIIDAYELEELQDAAARVPELERENKTLRTAIEFWVMARFPEKLPDPNDLGAQGQMQVAVDMAENTLRCVAKKSGIG